MQALLRFLASTTVKLVLLGAVGAGVYAGVDAFRQRAEARVEASRAEPAPLPVLVTRLVREPGYSVEDRFLGRLEPARRAALAFERGGLLTEVLVQEGASVAAGAPIARLDVTALLADRARLEAQHRQIAASLELARRTFERQQALGDQGHASSQRLDEARLGAELEAARLAEIEAALARLSVDIEKSVLTAPFAGTIAARSLDEGAVVSASAPVVEILESGAPLARIGLAPQAAAGLTVGERVPLVVDGRETHAEIVGLRPDLDGTTRTVTVLLRPLDTVSAAFGALVELRRERLVEEPGYWVPLEALAEGRRGLWSVLVAAPGADGEGTRVVREAVEVLHVADERAFVRGTLSPDAALLAGGAHRVAPGQRVLLANVE